MSTAPPRTQTLTSLTLVIACAPVFVACGSSDSESPPGYEGPPIPWEYEVFPSVLEPRDNPSSAAKIALGRLLFYDPILSRDQAVACASCHSEVWGLGDGLPLSIGVDGEGAVGPGRTGPTSTTRNAPSLWNVAFRTSLFWDGRAASLEEQALFPLDNEVEFDLDREQALDLLAGIAEYRDLFESAFPGEGVTEKNLARALATFQRTFVSDRSPYDLYVAGDEGALDDQMVRGMTVFADAGCARCHAPPLFSADSYVKRIEGEDSGRFEVTDDVADRGAFRVPSLRNLRETGPYFHDGRTVALSDAVREEVSASVEKGLSKALTEEEVDDLSAFIKKALMDRSREPTRPDRVPSGLPVPVDGLRVPR
jgi:cytochrome c peroxidase